MFIFQKTRRFDIAILTGLVVTITLNLVDNQLFAESVTDNFADGAWDDGTPIAWSIVNGSSSSASITDENSLRLDSSSGLIRIGSPTVSQDFLGDAVSIRGEGRVISGYLALSFPNEGHWTFLDSDGTLGIGMGSDTVLASADTSLDPAVDVIVQMDWIGNTVSAWAWHPNNPPVTEDPHVQFVTSRSRSFPSIFVNNGAVAEYASITISDEHLSVVPEPTGVTFLWFGAVACLLTSRRRRG